MFNEGFKSNRTLKAELCRSSWGRPLLAALIRSHLKSCQVVFYVRSAAGNHDNEREAACRGLSQQVDFWLQAVQELKKWTREAGRKHPSVRPTDAGRDLAASLTTRDLVLLQVVVTGRNHPNQRFLPSDWRLFLHSAALNLTQPFRPFPLSTGRQTSEPRFLQRTRQQPV